MDRDEESPYLSTKGPGAGEPPTLSQRVWKELKQNWWLWGAVVFTVVLISGLLLFRNQLYDSATHGLPFLAGTHHIPTIYLLLSSFSVHPPGTARPLMCRPAYFCCLAFCYASLQLHLYVTLGRLSSHAWPLWQLQEILKRMMIK